MEFASSIIGLVFDRLVNMAEDELRSLKGVGKDLEKLRSTLSTIRDVLVDAEARRAKEKALAGWLKELKDVAFDIDDVLDEIAATQHRPDQFMCKEMVRKCLSFPKSLKFRHEMAKKIKEIRERLDTISEQKDRYHLRVGAATEHSEAEGNRETGSFVDKSEVYGRDEDKEQIIDFLLHKCNEQNLGVISIVGLGGLGKTTLAQLAYNDDVRVSKHFETKMWVYVSKKFDIKNVIASIINSIEEGKKNSIEEGKKLEPLTKRRFEPSSMESAEQELLKQIGGKRFLLVLDDVWNEGYEQWDRLGRLLKNGAKGSKVIVTTRSKGVADAMRSDESLPLLLLPDDECWKLFKKHAFKSDDDDANNRNLEAIGKEIVKKCGGLPLAAKAIGSTLYNKREETWRAVRDDETWMQFKDHSEILPALMLSFNHLSPPLKQCFAYCSIVPKGTYINVWMLVQLWTAEGFVVDSSKGSSYVAQLISRSLLEGDVIEEVEFHRYAVVKMHDMVHNLAQFIAGDECFIVDTTSGKNRNFPPKSRHASLVLNEVTPSTTQILSSGQKLRTFCLTITERHSLFQSSKHSSHLVLETIVSNMQLLRALCLSYLPIEELPASITNLVHLRYLDLSSTFGLKSLPKTIGLLHNLQTLKLNHTELVTLPKSIGDLAKLLTLEIYSCESLSSLPITIGKLQQLQYLDLSRDTNLQALPTTIGTLQCLQALNLRFCGKLKELPDIESMRSLTHLRIHGCDSLTSMHAGIGQFSQLRALTMYVLGDGEKCASLSELGTLMNLEGLLCIKNLQKVKDVAEASAANLREKQRINRLDLKWDFDADWEEDRYDGIDDFENKRKELIERVADMDEEHAKLLEGVLSSLQPHQKLERLGMKGYIGKRLPGWIMDLSHLVELKLDYFSRFDNLQELEKLSCLEVLALRALPFIECLPRLGQLPRLKRLALYMLPRVKCLGSELYGGVGAFPALESLLLVMMLGLEEWSGKSISDEGDDFLSRLSGLDVRDCPKLQALPPTIFPSVKFLRMNVDDGLILSYLERGAFPNLHQLGVYNCIDTEDESSMPEALVQRLHSVPQIDKYPKEIRWDRSMLELEKMRLETLERIATEIEKKLVI